MKDYGTCIHEAAHAIIGYYYGFKPRKIHANDDYSGYVIYDQRKKTRSKIKLAHISIAGSCAEHLFNMQKISGPTNIDQYSDDDLQQIFNYGFSKEDLPLIRSQCNCILLKHKKQLIKLAKYLQIKNIESFKEFEKAVLL